MNQVVLVGRLCSEPEMYSVGDENDKQKSVVTLAINRPFKNADGIYETDFIKCVLWNNIALNTFEYCHKGDVVGVKGRLQTNNYEDKDENKKFVMKVVAEKVTFLSSSKSAPENERE